MTYVIRKETYKNVHRWKLERTNEDGSSTWVISHYQTRAAALNHARLLAGRHGAGAALHAYQHCGAEFGVGVGLTGRSYAIPTKDKNICVMPLAVIDQYVKDFMDFARANPSMYFQVTPIGCGLAGYRQYHIRPLFRDMPSNCFFSAEWRV